MQPVWESAPKELLLQFERMAVRRPMHNEQAREPYMLLLRFEAVAVRRPPHSSSGPRREAISLAEGGGGVITSRQTELPTVMARQRR
ncbi:MAG: hypothetical protein C4334_14350 [Pyrinomonas sp.]